MTHHFLLALALVAAATVGGVGLVAGQSTPTATPAGTDTATAEERSVSIDVSPIVQVTSWEFEGGEWRIGLRADAPTRVTVTDVAALTAVLAEGEGAASATIRSRTVTVEQGRSTLRIEGSTYQGMAAVTLSGRADDLVVLRTEALSTGRPSVAWGTAQLLAVLAAVGGVGISYRVLRDREGDDGEPERIA